MKKETKTQKSVATSETPVVSKREQKRIAKRERQYQESMEQYKQDVYRLHDRTVNDDFIVKACDKFTSKKLFPDDAWVVNEEIYGMNSVQQLLFETGKHAPDKFLKNFIYGDEKLYLENLSIGGNIGGYLDCDFKDIKFLYNYTGIPSEQRGRGEYLLATIMDSENPFNNIVDGKYGDLCLYDNARDKNLKIVELKGSKGRINCDNYLSSTQIEKKVAAIFKRGAEGYLESIATHATYNSQNDMAAINKLIDTLPKYKTFSASNNVKDNLISIFVETLYPYYQNSYNIEAGNHLIYTIKWLLIECLTAHHGTQNITFNARARNVLMDIEFNDLETILKTGKFMSDEDYQKILSYCCAQDLIDYYTERKFDYFMACNSKNGNYVLMDISEYRDAFQLGTYMQDKFKFTPLSLATTGRRNCLHSINLL